jgi:NAD(P)-dependent dehydrogenase (short-subunit alcohol dehydrogenase family)
MSQFEGKVALVTGAGSGIGRAAAVRLARDGASVCIADIDQDGADETASMVREFGRDALVVKANTASKPQVQDAVAQCARELGGVDIAFANAGIGRTAPLLEMELKEWQDQVDVNLTGVFLTVQATAQQMVRQGRGGRIICTASLAAETTGAGIWSYSATKAGVRMMVRGWAQELGPHGITVNAIGPGVIDTPLAKALSGSDEGPIRKALEERTPVGRVGRPDDIAGLVAFIAGPDGAFMSGSYVIMDGGLRDAGRRMDESGTPIGDERMQLAMQAMERRNRLQPLIDER